MCTNRARKWIAGLVGALVLVVLAGAGTALASPSHQGPATSAPSYTQEVYTGSQIRQWQAGTPWWSWTWKPTGQTASQTGHEWTVTGIVRSVDQAKQTFTVRPSGQTTTVTIAYDVRTGIPRDHWTMQGSRGMPVVVQVMMRRDGSWYATRIAPVAVQGKSGPARVQSGSFPTWRDGPCGWSEHDGSGDSITSSQ